MPSIHPILELDFSKRKTRAGMGERLFFFCITYRRWAQSTSYNVAHPACDLKGFTYLSPVHAYEVLSQYRSSTTSTPRQPMVEFLVFTSSRFPLQKSEEKFTPAETRTLKFRLSGHMLTHYTIFVGLNRGEMGRSLVTTRGMGNVVAR